MNIKEKTMISLRALRAASYWGGYSDLSRHI